MSVSPISSPEPRGTLIDCDEPRSSDETPTFSDEEFIACSSSDSCGDEHAAFYNVLAPGPATLTFGDRRVAIDASGRGPCPHPSARVPPATRRPKVTVVCDTSSDEEVVFDPPPPAPKRRKGPARVVSSTPVPTLSLEPVAPVTVGPANAVSTAPKQGQLYKHWTCTWNNFPLEWDDLTEEGFTSTVGPLIAQMFADKGLPVAYLCAGKEKAPTTGTRHLQMFVAFTQRRRKTALIKANSALFYTPSLGSVLQNKEYCEGLTEEKGNVRNPFFTEYGVEPKSGGDATKDKWKNVLDCARKGDFETIATDDPRFFITNLKNLEHVARKYSLVAPKFTNPVKHTGIWVWSKASGVGKSTAIRNKWPAAYLKAHDKQWNDYAFQEHALLDDFSRDDARALGADLKNWCDHLPFQGRILFGTVQVHLRHFIISSNYSIEDLFGNMGIEILAPIANRFRVFNFDQYNTWRDVPDDVFSDENIASKLLTSETL